MQAYLPASGAALASAAALITDQKADAWLVALDAADRAGALLAAGVVFVVRGRKP